MSRAARLLDLLQALRRRRRPVTAAVLAQELGVSQRTLYRDVATLIGRGAPIEGEAGLGYVMRSGFFLPPLSFDEDELDAVMLGLRLIARRGDADLAHAAQDALAKILAVLPPAEEDAMSASALLAGPPADDRPGIGAIRRALRAERKMSLSYRDGTGAATDRIVWPVALGFLRESDVLVAWCELRQDFRHFRLDRIVAAAPMEDRLPRRRVVLLAEWRAAERLSGP